MKNPFNKKTSCFIILALLLHFFTNSFASAINRPAIEGYNFGANIYSDPNDLAHFVCDPNHWPVSKIVFVDYHFYDEVEVSPSSSDPHPHVNIHCINTDTNQDQIVLRQIQYTEACSNWGSPQLWTGKLQCHDPDDKPPPLACGKPGKPAQPAYAVGDPIDLSTHETTQIEVDYQSPQGLAFIRQYSSLQRPFNSASGNGWHHNFGAFIHFSNKESQQLLQRQIYYGTLDGYIPKNIGLLPLKDYAKIERPDGYSDFFSSGDNGSSWQSDSDVRKILITSTIDAMGKYREWQLKTIEGNIDIFDSNGYLKESRSRSGQSRYFVYSDTTTPVNIAPYKNLLIKVSDNFGMSLNFKYDTSGRMIKMIDPAKHETTYAYDDSGNLTSVMYPDGLKKIYHHNEAENNPNLANNSETSYLLTGISEEISAGVVVRHVTIKYDTSRRPVSSELANAVNKYRLNYDTAQISDPLGTTRSHGYINVNGVMLERSQSQPGGAGCGASANYSSFDDNGNISSRTDFNGVLTTYTYDLSRNLETSRLEAAGTPQARTTSTAWHPTYRLPLKIAEPKLLTTLTYDANGNLLTRTQQATTDPSGALGLAAPVTGTARTWKWTWNAVGQMLTATGPRTDIVDKTTTTYDSTTGNMTTRINAAGQVTTFNSYDPNGRLTQMTDPNGTVTRMTYSPRGWLLTSAVQPAGATTPETTRYAYDGVGQLTSVTFPAGSVIRYTYDDAHRLVAIADSLGNTTRYTLDNMGNRTNEQVTDPGGTLARNITRVYDALNRLQQVTGAPQ